MRERDFVKEAEIKELQEIIKLTKAALTDPEKEKEWNAIRTSWKNMEMGDFI